MTVLAMLGVVCQAFLHCLTGFLMAALVSSSILDSSYSKTLLPWTIYMPEDDRMTVQGYYEMVVSKQPADVQEHFNDHILDEVRVGNTKNELDKVGNTGIDMNTVRNLVVLLCGHACIFRPISVIVDIFSNFLILFRYPILCSSGLIR